MNEVTIEKEMLDALLKSMAKWALESAASCECPIENTLHMNVALSAKLLSDYVESMGFVSITLTQRELH